MTFTVSEEGKVIPTPGSEAPNMRGVHSFRGQHFVAIYKPMNEGQREILETAYYNCVRDRLPHGRFEA